MISVKDAFNVILSSWKELSREDILEKDFSKSLNFFLAEDLLADRASPPFHRVAMDGVAGTLKKLITAENTEFPIEGVAPAGRPQIKLNSENHVIEVMTGAILPEGCDCVIPYEEVSIQGKTAVIPKLSLKKMQNVHEEGSDFKKNDVLILQGKRITSAIIGLMASIGKKTIKVLSYPRTAIISTGDELVSMEETPKDYQIRISNSFSLQAELLSFGDWKSDIFHIRDSKENLQIKISELLENYQLLIFSGGVSKGKFDFLPEVFNSLQVEKIFHKVAQRPGKPLYFGRGPSQQMIFGLPGNPVSALVSLRKYIVETYFLSKDHPLFSKEVLLNEGTKLKKDLTYFLSVKRSNNENEKESVSFVKGNGSGDFYSMAQSDGIAELDSHKKLFSQGESVKFYQWGN